MRNFPERQWLIQKVKHPSDRTNSTPASDALRDEQLDALLELRGTPPANPWFSAQVLQRLKSTTSEGPGGSHYFFPDLLRLLPRVATLALIALTAAGIFFAFPQPQGREIADLLIEEEEIVLDLDLYFSDYLADLWVTTSDPLF